jgi:small redox-active disulfide protein 1
MESMVLKKEINMTLFVAPNCPKCPEAKKIVRSVASMSKKIKVNEIDLTKDPFTALQNQVVSAPSIVINDEAIILGKIPKKKELIQAITRISSL